MRLNILQWNVWFKENPDNIVKNIIKWKADIICAQELIQDSRKNIDTAKYIANKLGFNCYYHQADTWDNREEKETQGNAIFSKYPIKKKVHYYVQEPKHNPLDASHEGRVYIETAVSLTNLTFKIGTTHLSYSDRFILDDHRRQESDNLVNILKKKNNKFVFTGDLNSTPTSYTVNQIEKYLTNAGPDYEYNTWTTKPFHYDNFKEDKLNWRLDYIFTTKDIKVKSAKVINSKYSDHLPILLTIEI